MAQLALNTAIIIAGSYNLTGDNIAGVATLALEETSSLTYGTGAGEANALYTGQIAVPVGETAEICLSGPLMDFWGQDLVFASVGLLVIQAATSNASPLIVGAGLWQGPFGAAGQGVSLLPGGIAVLPCPAAGWPVVSGADTILFTSAAAASFNIVIAGVAAVSESSGTGLSDESGDELETESGQAILPG